MIPDKKSKYTIVIDSDESLGINVIDILYELGFEWPNSTENIYKHCDKFSFELNYWSNGSITHCSRLSQEIQGECIKIDPQELLYILPNELFEM